MHPRGQQSWEARIYSGRSRTVGASICSQLLAVGVPHRGECAREGRVDTGIYKGGTRIVESETLDEKAMLMDGKRESGNCRHEQSTD